MFRQARLVHHRRGLRHVRFLDALLDIGVFRIAIQDFTELRAGAVKFPSLEEGEPEGFAQRKVLRIFFDERFQNIASDLGTVLRRKGNTRPCTRRRLFSQGRQGNGSLHEIRAERQDAMIKFFGHFKAALVFHQVTLQHKQLHIGRELRQGVFHKSGTAVELALIVVDVRHQNIGPRIGARRQANGGTAFVTGLHQVAVFFQQACVPEASLVKRWSLFGSHARQLQSERRIPHQEGLAAIQVRRKSRVGEKRLELRV